ncbi:GH92 family glycosyl hydrolase [Dawidia soli]|uniref:GH92 family glycosyl hydrolase n=1 Tax=Dawidia soli TaxID=2782352 RepID=A0AAP2D6Z4_9BACT|nr:GH92 family glycosyl hydrolase [Dawidia soli]MBT1685585.1 GH92 family glycosyl hydrolase [Dawidia soli]
MRIKCDLFRRAAFALIFAGLCVRVSAQEVDLVKYVNTLQGTNSTWDLSYGNTYPTTGLPFGMHFWSAQTGKSGDGWKYQYTAKTIRGFQQVHQCSPWMNDYGVFSLMPGTGKLTVKEEERALAFAHANETAKPHYYSVKFDNGIRTEMSPTERGAQFRFSFPKGDAFLVLDGYVKNSHVKIIPGERKIIGWVDNGRFVPQNFRNYFVMIFDQPFQAYGTWENKEGKIQSGNTLDEGAGKGAYLQFRPGAVVQVRVASSYIGPEQAELTFKQELGSHKKFEQTKDAAFKRWNTLLNRVLVEGDNEKDKATFYSCLFRANLFSRQFFEYDKDNKPHYYSPYDGKIHEGYMYTDNGFWDTFRSQFPLSNILHPAQQGRYMQALLSAQQECGWLPSWSNPGETGGMVGNHSISLLADAWAKGIRTFDPARALGAYLHEVTNKGPWGGANGREGFKPYFDLGFVPYPDYHESTAKTLEYAYDDFCAYQLAKTTGNTFYQKVFERQMMNYQFVFDPSTGFMRGKKNDGSWLPGFDPIEWGGPFTEGNAWHYTWSVFHDVQGLINLMGGEKRFASKLDSLFTMHSTFKVGTYGQTIHEMREMVLAKMGQYAHGNQPVQHAPYLYNYAGQPWKAQKQVRAIMTRLYNATENGFPGDEDQGGMSSWYVLSALGIYSVCPGTDQYVIGSPLFRKATITLENGKKFVIDARNNHEDRVYIQSALLNGKVYTHNWITYQTIMDGGVLQFEMSDTPALDRGTDARDKPFSVSNPEH